MLFRHLRLHCSRLLLAGLLAAQIGRACAAAAAAPVALPKTPEAWRAAVRADIEAAVQITRANHPGPLDPHNPGFALNLEAARRHGLALAAVPARRE